jgi:hypothetical protein
MTSRTPTAEARRRKLEACGLWPNFCRCGLPMEFLYGPGPTVEARAARAYRQCPAGHVTTASDVMRSRKGTIEG